MKIEWPESGFMLLHFFQWSAQKVVLNVFFFQWRAQKVALCIVFFFQWSGRRVVMYLLFTVE